MYTVTLTKPIITSNGDKISSFTCKSYDQNHHILYFYGEKDTSVYMIPVFNILGIVLN